MKPTTGEGSVDCDNVKPSATEESEERLVNCEDDDDPEEEIDIDIACEERQV